MIEDIFPEGKSRRSFLKSGSILSGLAFLSPATNVFLNPQNSIELTGDTNEFRFVHTSGLKAQFSPSLKGQWGGLNSASQSLDEAGFKGLKIDSGDFIHPDLSFSENLSFVQNLNEFGLHLAGLGKTELELSEEKLSKLIGAASFPLVNSNYKFKNPDLNKAVQKHLIVNFGNYRVGVIAVADDFGTIEKEVKNPLKTALRESEYLKYFRACDFVICLVNFESKPDSKDRVKNILAKKADHIDFILDANTTAPTPTLQLVKDNSGHDVFISRVLDCGKYLGEYAVTFNSKFSAGLVANFSNIPGVKKPGLTASLFNEFSNQTV